MFARVLDRRKVLGRLAGDLLDIDIFFGTAFPELIAARLGLGQHGFGPSGLGLRRQQPLG